MPFCSYEVKELGTILGHLKPTSINKSYTTKKNIIKHFFFKFL